MTDNPLAAGERVRAIPPPTAMVVFGGSGDLAHRKIVPALYNLELHRLLPQNFAFVGSSRSEYSDEEYRADMRKAVEEFSRTSPSSTRSGSRSPAGCTTSPAHRPTPTPTAASATCWTASTASSAPTATGCSTCR